MKIYYIEYQETVKFFNGDRSIEIKKGKLLERILKATYKKYGTKIKFFSLV